MCWYLSYLTHIELLSWMLLKINKRRSLLYHIKCFGWRWPWLTSSRMTLFKLLLFAAGFSFHTLYNCFQFWYIVHELVHQLLKIWQHSSFSIQTVVLQANQWKRYYFSEKRCALRPDDFGTNNVIDHYVFRLFRAFYFWVVFPFFQGWKTLYCSILTTQHWLQLPMA